VATPPIPSFKFVARRPVPQWPNFIMLILVATARRKHKTCVVMVVQPNEANSADQRFIEYQLFKE
jgi:hypothetical protein